MTVETLHTMSLQINNVKNNSLILLLFSALMSFPNSLQAAKIEAFVSYLLSSLFKSFN